MKQLELEFGNSKELNFNLNELSPNDRIYNKNVVLRELRKTIKEGKLFLSRYTRRPLVIGDIIGKVTSFTEENGDVKVDIEPIRGKEAILEIVRKVAIFGIGEIKLGNKVIKFKLQSLIPVPANNIMIR